MKEMKSIKKTALIVAGFIAVLGLSIGTTYALLRDETNGLNNTFTIGSVETEIVEQDMHLISDTKVYKEPVVKNVGLNDCYIRARVEISPSGENIKLGKLGSNWEQKGDYYYYKLPVAPERYSPNDCTTTALFSEVILPDGWVSGGKATVKFKDFDVIVYQEAVTADLEGEMEYTKIWQAYGLTE